jgi:ATP-dependent exoDNAse (exonuclease V) beta subunit
MRTLDRVLSDDWLRWALDGGRAARAAELPLTVATEGGTQALVLDYVFTDEVTGERWVVDYKTAEPRPGERIDTFESTQREHYRPQIEAYRRALSLAAPGPVRCALYFTALGRCCEIPAADEGEH